MPYTQTGIEGVYLFEPTIFEDARGEFYEAFRRDQCLAETGFEFRVDQVNTSVSGKGVIRGIHFKKFPPGQAKFVSVPQGKIISVVLDLRKSSATFLQWRAFELSSVNRKSLLIGYGVGHAFLSLEDSSKVSYLCDSVFDPVIEFGIHPMGANIEWSSLSNVEPRSGFSISPKDDSAPNLEEAHHLFFD